MGEIGMDTLRCAARLNRGEQIDVRTVAMRAAKIGVWTCDLRSGWMCVDEQVRRLWELAPDCLATLDEFCARVHRDERERVREVIMNASETPAAHVPLRCRIASTSGLPDRWVAIDGCTLASAAGEVRVVGTVREISGRPATQEQRVRQELEHRIKNTFAIVNALIGLSAREAQSAEQLATTARKRICALERAYSLLQRGNEPSARSVAAIVESQTRPLLQSSEQLTCYGPDLCLTQEQTLPMSMVIHELVTNAVKHGALSTPGGRLSVSWSVKRAEGPPQLVLRWDEASTVAVLPPKRCGTGSELIAAGTRLELGGAIEQDYRPSGLLAILRIPLAASCGATAALDRPQ